MFSSISDLNSDEVMSVFGGNKSKNNMNNRRTSHNILYHLKENHNHFKKWKFDDFLNVFSSFEWTKYERKIVIDFFTGDLDENLNGKYINNQNKEELKKIVHQGLKFYGEDSEYKMNESSVIDVGNKILACFYHLKNINHHEDLCFLCELEEKEEDDNEKNPYTIINDKIWMNYKKLTCLIESFREINEIENVILWMNKRYQEIKQDETFFDEYQKLEKKFKERNSSLLKGKLYYEGEWGGKNGNKFHGIGNLYHVKKKFFKTKLVLLYSGMFEEGKMCDKNGKVYHDDGKTLVYYGGMSNSKRDGYGIEFDKEGKETKRGKWKKNQFVKRIKTKIQVKQIDQSIMDSFKTEVLEAKYSDRQKYVIGKGNFGVVYKFQGLAFKHLEYTDKIDESIKREIAILQEVDHPYIIKIEGVNSKGTICIVTELCKKSVFHYLCDIEREKLKKKMGECYLLPDHLKLKIMLETSLGMEYLHLLGCWHRDLKWNNVLLKSIKVPTVKIIDFGLSKFIQPSTEQTFCGSFMYMAPEVVEKQYNEKSDVFSFGIMLYQLFFEKTNPYSDYQNIVFDSLPYRVRKGLRPKIPNDKYSRKHSWIVSLITACWEGDQNKRPTFKQIVEEIIRRTKQKKGNVTKQRDDIFFSIENEKKMIELERKKVNKEGVQSVSYIQNILWSVQKEIEGVEDELEYSKDQYQQLNDYINQLKDQRTTLEFKIKMNSNRYTMYCDICSNNPSFYVVFCSIYVCDNCYSKKDFSCMKNKQVEKKMQTNTKVNCWHCETEKESNLITTKVSGFHIIGRKCKELMEIRKVCMKCKSSNYKIKPIKWNFNK